MATVLHYVRSHAESSLAALANLYGISGSAISNATFGGSGASLIYPWLRDNGGTRQASAPQVPTGYHWSFAPGMVVNIPGVAESLSPVSYYADPPAVPGGPEVTVLYSDSPVVGETGNPSEGREQWSEITDGAVADVDPALVDPATGQEVGYAGIAAGEGFLGLSWTAWLIVGVAVYALMGKKKGKRKYKRKTTRRRTTRGRRRRNPRRRRNYYRSYYGDDD